MKKISLTYKSELSTLVILLMLLLCCGCDTVSDKSQTQLSYASDKNSQSMDTNNSASDESQGSDDTITGFLTSIMTVRMIHSAYTILRTKQV